MKYLFILIALIIAALILRYSGMRRFLVYLTGIILLPHAVTIIEHPFIPAPRFLAIVFMISVALRPRTAVYAIRKCPWYIWAGLLLVYFGHIMTAVMDHRLAVTTALTKAHLRFIDTYLLLAIGYFSLYRNRNLVRMNRYLVVASIIVAAYGLATGVLGNDIYSNAITRSFSITTDFTPLGTGTRTRLCSFLFNSHIFGFFCAAAFSMIFLFNRKDLLQKRIPLTAMVLCFLGTFFSGSRSSLVALLLIFAFISLVTFSSMQRLRATIAAIAIIVAVLCTPALRNKVKPVADAFRTGYVETGGSSLELRKNQLDIALLFYKKSPTWGNGFDYYAEMLTPDQKLIKSEGLAGAESYAFMLLIENGWVQIVILILFMLILTGFFLTHIRQHPIYATWGLCILALMLFVALASGIQGNWKFSLPFIGMAIRALVNTPVKRNKLTVI